MLFSRKNLITKGKRPLYAASSAFAKCHHWSASRLRRAYSGKAPSEHPETTGFDDGLYHKLMNAWTQTPTKWYPLPLAVGALLLVAIQYRKKKRAAEILVDEHGVEVVKLRGPWQVHVMGSLPLRNMSRLWGYVNSLELPEWLRPYGFRLYAYAFGCNLDEIERELGDYKSLGEFFERRLREGVRPVEQGILVSPADGTVLHFGTVTDSRVEQVKGLTYSLDALLGVERPGTPLPAAAVIRNMPAVDDREFANVNGIEYTLDQLIGSSGSGNSTPTEEHPPSSKKIGQQTDESVPRDVSDTLAHDTNVALEMGSRPALTRGRSTTTVKPGNSLFFTVIYLAPGDYHRFHSPTAWVVEKRRHFPGELFSVSPYMAKRLENLFVLNERVALLGRWRHGFFGMIPVGATNVGSIKINFDQELRTNLRRRRRDRNTMPPGSYTEAVYSAASPVLNGQPLTYAQEMGGFCLGSTIVLVFEAPDDFEFNIKAEQKVKVGQKLGDVRKSNDVVASPTPINLVSSPLKSKID